MNLALKGEEFLNRPSARVPRGASYLRHQETSVAWKKDGHRSSTLINGWSLVSADERSLAVFYSVVLLNTKSPGTASNVSHVQFGRRRNIEISHVDVLFHKANG